MRQAAQGWEAALSAFVKPSSETPWQPQVCRGYPSVLSLLGQ